MQTVDVAKSKRREQIPLLGRENENVYHFQVAAFKVIHGGHYILGPKSKKVSAGKGQSDFYFKVTVLPRSLTTWWENRISKHRRLSSSLTKCF